MAGAGWAAPNCLTSPTTPTISRGRSSATLRPPVSVKLTKSCWPTGFSREKYRFAMDELITATQGARSSSVTAGARPASHEIRMVANSRSQPARTPLMPPQNFLLSAPRCEWDTGESLLPQLPRPHRGSSPAAPPLEARMHRPPARDASCRPATVGDMCSRLALV